MATGVDKNTAKGPGIPSNLSVARYDRQLVNNRHWHLTPVNSCGISVALLFWPVALHIINGLLPLT
jgi:hypothetical protein